MWIALSGALLSTVAGCSSGGDSSSTTPTAAWPEFRHDSGKTGQGVGTVLDNNGSVKWVQVDDSAAVSASPAIALDGSVYVGSEGGILVAVSSSSLSVRWRIDTCVAPSTTIATACPAGEQPLGPLFSSSAVYTLNAVNTVMIGSGDGKVFAFDDSGGASPTCVFCFQPSVSDFVTDQISTEQIDSVSVSFVSSPTFSSNLVTLTIEVIYIGASAEVKLTNGSTVTVGKLYALNRDGSLRWQFPRPGRAPIAPITSSPAQTLGAGVDFVTDDGLLVALTKNGETRWAPVLVGAGAIADTIIAPSAISYAEGAFAGNTAGEIVAVNPDGTTRWRTSTGSGDALPGFVGSLALGVRPLSVTTPSPSPSPKATSTPGGLATQTPTLTPTPVPAVFNWVVFGFSGSGHFVGVDGNFGTLLSPSSPAPVVPAPVVSSPALSSDQFVVVGGDDGKLYAFNAFTGELPTSGWPVQLPTNGSSGPYKAIRSSPTITSDGAIFVGADDGRLYAVGKQ